MLHTIHLSKHATRHPTSSKRRSGWGSLRALPGPWLPAWFAGWAWACCTLLPGGARAADPSIDIAANEVYLDTRTGRLSGRMRVGYDAANINHVAIVAPENSEVILSYWQRDKRDCVPLRPGEPLPDFVQQRSGAPTGAVVPRNGVREQKFIAKVAPLTTSRDYCLYYEVKSLTPLRPDEDKRVDAALDATVDALAGALDGTASAPAAAPGSAPAAAPGSAPAAAPAVRACLELLNEPRAEVSAADFARLFACRLGWPFTEWEVVHPTTQQRLTIQNAVQLYLEQDAELRAVLTAAWQMRTNALSRRAAIVAGLSGARDSLDALLASWPAAKAELTYDPVPSVEPAAFVGSLQDAALATVFAPVQADRAAFVHALWDNRTLLQQTGKRKALGTTEEGQLKAFWNAKVEAKLLRVPREGVATLRKELAAGIDDPARRKAALAKAPALPEPSELDQYPPQSASDLMALKGLSLTVKRLRADSDALEANLAVATSAVLKHPGYQSLKANARSVLRPSGVQRIAAEPTYEERLPFWVTADVGVVVGFFSAGAGSGVHPGASMSFGLNFYLSELDKAEPLRITQWSGRDWLRRFSITAGMTLTDPSGVDEFGLDGVIDGRLLMTGVGLRLTDYVRLSGGALYYTQDDTSPLSDEKHIKLAPYLSGSIDIDVIGTIQGWASDAKDVAP